MKDAKHTIVVIVTVAAMLIVCLAAIAFLAPTASPIGMLGVIGMIMIAVLALSLGREFFIRFDVDNGRRASGEFGSTAAPTAVEVSDVATAPRRRPQSSGAGAPSRAEGSAHHRAKSEQRHQAASVIGAFGEEI